MPRALPTPTGARCSLSTTSCTPRRPPRWWPSTARWRSPRSRARRPPSRWSTACPSRATTRTTRPGPTSCAGWGVTPPRRRPTTAPSTWRRTRPNDPSWPGGAPTSAEPGALEAFAVDEHEGDETQHRAVATEPGVAVRAGGQEGLGPVGRVSPRRECPVGQRAGPRPLVLVPLLEGAHVPVHRLVTVLAGQPEEAGQVGELVGGGLERDQRGVGRRGVPDGVAEQHPATRREVTAHGIQRAARAAEDVAHADGQHRVEDAALPGGGVGLLEHGPPAEGRGEL